MSLQANFTNFKVSSARLYTWAAALVAILLALAAPFILLTTGGRSLASLSWVLWVVLPLILLVTVLAGVSVFLHVSHHAADISISPDRRGAEREL